MNVVYDITREESIDHNETKDHYLKSLRMIERLQRLLLDVIKDEFERLGHAEVNSVQAQLLFNIGEAELTAGELRSRGYYLGSNVSYNLKKLVEAGYIHHQRSANDRRSVRVSLTEKGKQVCRVINDLYDRQMDALEKVGGVKNADLVAMNDSLLRLERFWGDQIRYRL